MSIFWSIDFILPNHKFEHWPLQGPDPAGNFYLNNPSSSLNTFSWATPRQANDLYLTLA